MALANDMTKLLDKFSRRYGLIIMEKYLPKELNRQSWAKTVIEDSLVEFSRYFPNKFPIVVNDETCNIVRNHPDDPNSQYRGFKSHDITKYYVRDEVLGGCKLLGVKDIDWTDFSTDNIGLSSASLGNGYYYPNIAFACPEAMFQDVMAMQFNADMTSLFNRGILIQFDENLGYFTLEGLGNVPYDIRGFVVELLTSFDSISSVSPTKMGIFERLAFADIASLLVENLRFFDPLSTVYVDIDLKLDRLREVAQTREQVIDELKESYVSAANDNIPYIMSV